MQKLPGLDGSFIMLKCSPHKLLGVENKLWVTLYNLLSLQHVQEGRLEKQKHESCTQLYLKTPPQNLMGTASYIAMAVARRAKLKLTAESLSF